MPLCRNKGGWWPRKHLDECTSKQLTGTFTFRCTNAQHLYLHANKSAFVIAFASKKMNLKNASKEDTFLFTDAELNPHAFRGNILISIASALPPSKPEWSVLSFESKHVECVATSLQCRMITVGELLKPFISWSLRHSFQTAFPEI